MSSQMNSDVICWLDRWAATGAVGVPGVPSLQVVAVQQIPMTYGDRPTVVTA